MAVLYSSLQKYMHCYNEGRKHADGCRLSTDAYKIKAAKVVGINGEGWKCGCASMHAFLLLFPT